MNSYREALSRPIGGVGNPSPGNSCQRPQELIGCVCTALAKLTGEAYYWGDVSRPLLLQLYCMVSLCSFNLLFICFHILCLFLCGDIHFRPLYFSAITFLSPFYQYASTGASHPCFTLFNLRGLEKTVRVNRSCLVMAIQRHSGAWVHCYHSWKCNITQSSRSGPCLIWISEMSSGHEVTWGMAKYSLPSHHWFRSNKLLDGYAEPHPPAPSHMNVLKVNSGRVH